ncbi:alpha/beta hydrolase [Streptomyces roseifaciens]
MGIRTTAAVAAVTAFGAGAAALAAGRYASDAALRASPGGPPPDQPRLAVHAVDGDLITLTRDRASLRPGTYGLTGSGLHAVVGAVVHDAPHAADAVVRRLEGVTRGVPEPGDRVWMTPQLHAGNPRDALGLDHADVMVPGELGPLPAWFLPAARETWVITVHGLGATREHPMVVMPLLHRLRLPVLDLAYRGDSGAPGPPDGISRFGLAEWHDLAAAVRYALAQGARRIVLHGWSTGATMALLAAGDPALRPHISGLVMDSPVLDWPAALHSLAAARGVPAPLLPLALHAARGRTGMAPDGLARVRDPARLTLPVLLAHGPDDTVAPWRTSRELAASRPDLIVLHTVARAPHAAMWNAAPGRYEEALRRFLIPLM